MGWTPVEGDPFADDDIGFEDLQKKREGDQASPLAPSVPRAGDQPYTPFGAFGQTAQQPIPQRFPTEMRAWTPEERARLDAQKPALGKTDKGGERPGFFGVLGEAGKRGAIEGLSSVAEAPTAFKDRPLAEMPQDEVGQLMRQQFSEGWRNPRWWAAHIAHGTAAASPSLAAGLAGAAGGSSVGGPAGALAGGAAGFGLGSMIQSLAPSYQRARAEGLDHDKAVDRAITESGISGVTGAAMGLAPGASWGLRGPISQALAQIFAIQPAIGMTGTVASRAATGQEMPSADDLATQYATQVGTGAILTGVQTAGRAAPRWWEAARDRWLRSREPEIPVTPLTRAEPGLPAERPGPGEIDFGDLVPADRARLEAPRKRLGYTEPSEPAPMAGAEPPPSSPPSPLRGGPEPAQAATTTEVLPAPLRSPSAAPITVEAAPVPPTIRTNVIAETIRQMEAVPQMAGLLRAEQQRTGETPEQVITRVTSQGDLANQFAQTANEVALTGRASRSAMPLAQAVGRELGKPVETREAFQAPTDAALGRGAPRGRAAEQVTPGARPVAPEATRAQTRPTMAPERPTVGTEDILPWMAFANEAQGQVPAVRGVDVLQFIRSKGGLKPSRELSQLDARRYPGLINRNGLSADKMREAMVEAGYLREAGPDQPAITTPADVYDLLSRSISGERIVPEADQESDAAFSSNRAARDARRELQAAERAFIKPELERYDAEMGTGNAMWEAYLALSREEKDDVIDRNRRGEDIIDLMEEKATQNPMFYALGAPVRRGPDRDNLGFYSKALESANALKQNKGTSEQMLAQLESAGTKNAEIEATGLDQFLLGPELAQQRKSLLAQSNAIAGLKSELANTKTPPTPERAAQIQSQLATAQSALVTATVQYAQAAKTGSRPVTKQEIVDFLEKNRVRLRETKYGGIDINDLPSEMRDEFKERELESLMESGDGYEVYQDADGLWQFGLYGELSGKSRGYDLEEDARDDLRSMLESDVDNMPDRELAERWMDRDTFESAKTTEGGARWREYSLDEDNPTYRETLLNIPHDTTARQAHEAEERRLNRKYWDSHRQHWTVAATPEERAEMTRLEGEMLAENKRNVDNAYQSGHWRDTPNVVAHIRSQMLTDTKGRQVYNLDELQSDWGQGLREKGGRDPEKIKAAEEKFVDASEYTSEMQRDAEKLLADNPDTLTPRYDLPKPYGEHGSSMINPTAAANWEGRYRVEGVMETPFVLGSFQGRITHWPQTFNWQGEPTGERYIVNGANGEIQNAQAATLDDAKFIIQRHINALPLRRRLEMASIKALAVDESPARAIQIREAADALVKAQQAENLAEAEMRTMRAAAPSHPLVNATDQWVTTAMRRVIQQAVDAGADGISITPGKVQNERFGLSNQIEALRYVPETGSLLVIQKDGSAWSRIDNPNRTGGAFKPEDLPGTVGQEIAGRLLESPTEQAPIGGTSYAAHTLRGIDLEIGGQGMKATYDGIYPRTLGKLLQKLDPSIKAEKTKLLPSDYNPNSRISLDELRKDTPFENDFIFFPLTDKAKAKLEEEGQPMFALGGKQTETAEFKKWFGDSKVVDENGQPLVVYHGTSGEDFSTFEQRPSYSADVGFYFTPDTEYASGYASAFNQSAAPDGARLKPVYLSLQNPKYVLTKPNGRNGFDDIARQKLIEEGYDGLIVGVLDHEIEDGVRSIRDANEIVAFSPNQIKSATGNRGSFDPNDDRITYALKGFYSPAIRAVENIKQGKATPEQWWSMISKTPAVRMEELQWMGLKEWLDSFRDQGDPNQLSFPFANSKDKNSIAKADVLRFMEAHQMELDDRLLESGDVDNDEKEEWIGERADSYRNDLESEWVSERMDEWRRKNEPYYEITVEQDNDKAAENEELLANGGEEIPTWYFQFDDQNRNRDSYDSGYDADEYFFSEYSARSAAVAKRKELMQNYEDEEERERSSLFEDVPDYIYHEAYGQAARDWNEEMGEKSVGDTKFKSYAIPGGSEYRELLVQMPYLAERGYSSPHFSDHEVVHLRFDTREGPNGDRVMFIHEIQSDLHQRAREFGYGEEGAAEAARAIQGAMSPEQLARLAEIDRQMLMHQEARRAYAESLDDMSLTGEQRQPLLAASHAAQDAEQTLWRERATIHSALEKRANKARTYQSTFGLKGAPEAPYTGNAWWELGFKRAAQYAVENGFNAIALTTPEQIRAASGTPEHVAKKFYGENLPRFIDKYVKKWEMKPGRAGLSGTDNTSVDYVPPATLTGPQAADFFESIINALEQQAGGAGYLQNSVDRMRQSIGPMRASTDAPPQAVFDAIHGDATLRTWAQRGYPTKGIAPLFQQVVEGGNLYYRISDKMRQDITDVGQPLATAGKSVGELKKQIGAMLRLGRSIDLKHADEVLAEAEQYRAAVPEDTAIIALARVSPVKGQKGRVIATFKSDSGESFTLEGDWESLSTARAFFSKQLLPKRSVALIRFAPPGRGDKRLGGEVRHEALHAVRQSGSLPAPVFAQLLSHAKSLQILSSDLRTYLQAIGDPDYKSVTPGDSLLDAYLDRYKGRSDIKEAINQEYVAHLVELYSHGVLLPQEVGPVKELLDNFFAGAYSNATGENRLSAGTMHAFAGPMAKTASEHRAILAKTMAQKGVDPFTIWKETGWFKAPDGRWKFEIDDSQAKLTLSENRLTTLGVTGGQSKLGKILSHDPLFAAYPEFADITLIFDNNMPVGNGGNYATENLIALGVKDFRPGQIDRVKRTLLHEIQHSIQDKERFARGSSPAWQGVAFDERASKGLETELDKRIMSLDTVRKASKELMTFIQAAKADPGNVEIQEGIKFFTRRFLQTVGYELYLRQGGEVEAREVEHRMGMSAEDRRAAFPVKADANEQMFTFGDDAGRFSDDALSTGAPGDVTETAEFKRWFGESKVVDENGKPLVVYHGTLRGGFDRFDRGMDNRNSGTGATGFYFTNHKLAAQTYSNTRNEALISDDPEFDVRYDSQPGIYAVYLSMNDPLIVDFQGGDWSEAPEDSGFGGDSINDISEYAESAGYDGVIAKNLTDEGGYGKGYGWGDTTYIVFKPTQIKSATQNRGAFDPDDDRITYALAGKRAVGAPQGAFQAAERMEGRGAKPDAIWNSTGTYRGAEGKWRWEIDDSGARIINLDKVLGKASGILGMFKGRSSGAVQSKTNVPLLNILDHPKLYNAYPFLRQMKVDLTYGPGVQAEGTMRKRNTAKGKVYKPIQVKGSNPEELKATLLHEVQHYIQDREGFATGSDQATKKSYEYNFTGEPGKSNALYDPAKRDDETVRLRGGPQILEPSSIERYAMDILDGFEKLDEAKARKAAGETMSKKGRISIDEEIAGWERDIEATGRQLEDAMLVKPGDYANSAGEQEANEVEARMNMTPEARRKKRPTPAPAESIVSLNTQTRDYDKAYSQALKQAEVWKRIRDQWKTAKDIGGGISVVRPWEDQLIYAEGPSKPLVNLRLSAENARAEPEGDFEPAFYRMSYPEQKKAMDAIFKDLRSRNVRPGVPSYLSDEAFAFWAKYDPRMVAFDLRLYRDEIEQMAKEDFGSDAEVEIDGDEAYVTSPRMRNEAEKANLDHREARKKVYELEADLIAKYGSIVDFKIKAPRQELSRYRDVLEKEVKAREARDVSREVYLDLSPIFEGRNASPAPAGIDPDMWREMITDEQLAHMGKTPQPGDDVDFADLVAAQ